VTTSSATICALLASEDEDEFAEVSKAAPPVDAQNSDNHAGDVKGQEVEEVEKIRRYPLRNRTQTPAWNLSAHATHTLDSPTISSDLASSNKDKWIEAVYKKVSALALAGRRERRAVQDAAGSASTRQLLSEPSIVWDMKRRICRARARPATVQGTASVRSWLASLKAMMGRSAASHAWMLAGSISRTGTRFVEQGMADAMIVAGSVRGGGCRLQCLLPAAGEVRPRQVGG
jgi:hypothetical protein